MYIKKYDANDWEHQASYDSVSLNGKPNNTTRIIVIGDSTSEWGDPNWPEVLRNRFNETSNHTNTNVEVWNLARSSLMLMKNETSQYDYRNSDMFKWAIKSQPDIVFIMIGSNDAHRIWMEDWDIKKMTASINKDFFDLSKQFVELPSHPFVYNMIPPPFVHSRIQVTIEKKKDFSEINTVLPPVITNVTGVLF